MIKKIDPQQNYEASRKAVGYIPRAQAVPADYERVGFKAGLEVHQQLKTRKKLFCNCPSGVYNAFDDFDAEIIRHMRPTLSELGEYDGTALMEFKTRKQIVYRIKNETACTYDIDDTPPFPINREALEIALICRLNIVGEVHITRKQYLDGSIPTGFQRTAILGVEGELPLRDKTVRLIQLSIEEDSCREISDVGHVRTYQTDRLGNPLIETVTYPDFTTPDEIREGAEYIRFLNRSTGRVVTGIGAGREDVNVSCRGGTRIEIKGVSHNKWIPELTHNEVFRQWALLRIRELLNRRVKGGKGWKISSKPLDDGVIVPVPAITAARERKESVVACNLPYFQGILSHFTQPGKVFAGELSDRLKVIACIEKPNLVHSEQLVGGAADSVWAEVRSLLNAGDQDGQLIIWGPEEDIPTALETIEERCLLAFEGVPRESRKSFVDGTTIFERVLPGADRMYPDTDSAPIPLDDDDINGLAECLPVDVHKRFAQMKDWRIPEDAHYYLLSRNLLPLIEEIVNNLEYEARFVGTLLGHGLKHIEGCHSRHPDFSSRKIYDLLAFLKRENIAADIAFDMLREIYQHPNMDFESILTTLKFQRRSEAEITSHIPYLRKKFSDIDTSHQPGARTRWIMGELRGRAVGNIPLNRLREIVDTNPSQ